MKYSFLKKNYLKCIFFLFFKLNRRNLMFGRSTRSIIGFDGSITSQFFVNSALVLRQHIKPYPPFPIILNVYHVDQ